MTLKEYIEKHVSSEEKEYMPYWNNLMGSFQDIQDSIDKGDLSGIADVSTAFKIYHEGYRAGWWQRHDHAEAFCMATYCPGNMGIEEFQHKYREIVTDPYVEDRIMDRFEELAELDEKIDQRKAELEELYAEENITQEVRLFLNDVLLGRLLERIAEASETLESNDLILHSFARDERREAYIKILKTLLEELEDEIDG